MIGWHMFNFNNIYCIIKNFFLIHVTFFFLPFGLIAPQIRYFALIFFIHHLHFILVVIMGNLEPVTRTVGELVLPAHTLVDA